MSDMLLSDTPFIYLFFFLLNPGLGFLLNLLQLLFKSCFVFVLKKIKHLYTELKLLFFNISFSIKEKKTLNDKLLAMKENQGIEVLLKITKNKH